MPGPFPVDLLVLATGVFMSDFLPSELPGRLNVHTCRAGFGVFYEIQACKLYPCRPAGLTTFFGSRKAELFLALFLQPVLIEVIPTLSKGVSAFPSCHESAYKQCRWDRVEFQRATTPRAPGRSHHPGLISLQRPRNCCLQPLALPPCGCKPFGPQASCLPCFPSSGRGWFAVESVLDAATFWILQEVLSPGFSPFPRGPESGLPEREVIGGEPCRCSDVHSVVPGMRRASR